MSLVDSHCHLEMIADTATAVAEARAAGVTQIITIGIDLASSRQAIELAATEPGVYATVGLHPPRRICWTTRIWRRWRPSRRSRASSPSARSAWTSTATFAARGAARRVRRADRARAGARLPLVVHVREAGDEAMAQLAAQASDLTVVMHCYSLPQYVDECNERGYYASFAGNVTYKNAAGLREAAGKVRDDRLLVETDAPFLAPVPNRGNSNVPSWVAYTAALVAEVRGVPAAELAALTTTNARRVFALAEAD